jgi:hypothetical protein
MTNGIQMSNYLRGVDLRDAKNRVPAGPLMGIGFLLALVVAIPLAQAENGPLYVAPGPSNLISLDVTKPNQDQLGGGS